MAKARRAAQGRARNGIGGGGRYFPRRRDRSIQVWCDRVGVDLIKQKQGSDPAAVAFDAVKAAVARKAEAVLIDTAGRLQTKVNLMEELKKIARVVGPRAARRAARNLAGARREYRAKRAESSETLWRDRAADRCGARKARQHGQGWGDCRDRRAAQTARPLRRTGRKSGRPAALRCARIRRGAVFRDRKRPGKRQRVVRSLTAL